MVKKVDGVIIMEQAEVYGKLNDLIKQSAGQAMKKLFGVDFVVEAGKDGVFYKFTPNGNYDGEFDDVVEEPKDPSEWYGYEMNPYYNPEKCGLQLVYSYDRDDEPYQFNLVALWKHLATGKYYVGEDSGCSCPTPFEDFNSLADMTEVDEHEIKRILDQQY
ncbi:MAG: hypothetical protein WC554_09250 [Clostridia bacterium]